MAGHLRQILWANDLWLQISMFFLNAIFIDHYREFKVHFTTRSLYLFFSIICSRDCGKDSGRNCLQNKIDALGCCFVKKSKSLKKRKSDLWTNALITEEGDVVILDVLFQFFNNWRFQTYFKILGAGCTTARDCPEDEKCVNSGCWPASFAKIAKDKEDIPGKICSACACYPV